ncbi:MAG: hypothetical protein GY929_01915 [Actinomycetia bacterium]|nr:hypothetical protein [Actinomycetes bacterium]
MLPNSFYRLARQVDIDAYVTDEEMDALRAHLAGLDVTYSIETYPGTEHGFVFPERYCFSPEGADTHYRLVAEKLARTLR